MLFSFGTILMVQILHDLIYQICYATVIPIGFWSIRSWICIVSGLAGRADGEQPIPVRATPASV